MAANQPSPPSSSASSTDIENIQGPLTLAQFVNEIETITGSNVENLNTGSTKSSLLIYRRNAQQPVVDPNLVVDAAVAQREAHAIADAQARTDANLAIGRHRVSPKRAERVNNTIYFSATCEDNVNYSVSWRP